MTSLTLDLLIETGAPDGPSGAEDGEQDGRRGGDPSHDAPPAAEARGRRTLDELIVGVWEDLSAHRAAVCPVCAEAMRPRYGSGPASVGGRCTGCGSTLG